MPFDNSDNYMKVIRFGGERLETEMRGYIAHIKERNENARIDGIYTRAKNAMNSASTESAYKEAAQLFESVSEYRDSAALAQLCYEKAEDARKDAILAKGKSKMLGEDISGYESAIEAFESISGWEDADEQVIICRRRIEELKAKAEAERLEKERKAELERKEAERIAMRNKKTAIIVAPIVCAVIAFIMVLNTVIIPNGKYNDAIALMDAGNHEAAITAFEAIEEYKDSKAQIEECKYLAAAKLMDAGDYEAAITAFEALKEYKDSTAQIEECKYLSALKLMGSGDYEAAITAFEAVEEYKDSEAQIEECKYLAAVKLMDTGRLYNAYSSFIKLGDYKDAAAKVKSIKNKMPKAANVGDYVVFGTYEQDNNTENGKEDIEWLVLAKEDNKILVISKYALDCQNYNKEYVNVTWETCTLRKWLNNDFVNAAFSADEKAVIPTVTVPAYENLYYNTNPGNATQDQVFLLDIRDANGYFSSDSARQCAPTDYAVANGAKKSDNGNCQWWLRTPGDDMIKGSAANVYSNGQVDDRGNNGPYAVRPALWIDIGA